MKKLSLLPLAALFLAGCGTQTQEVANPPEYEALLDSAWARYASGRYEEASATFDSVLVVNAYSSEAHLGMGYSLVQLSYYSDAFGSFSVVTVLEDAAEPYVETLMVVTLDTSALGSTVDTSWFSQVRYGDTLGVWRFRIAPAGALLNVYELVIDGAKQFIVGVDDEYVYVASKEAPFSDTTEHNFSISYSYYRPDSISDLAWYAYIGRGTTAYIEGTNKALAFANLRLAHLALDSLGYVAPQRVVNALNMDGDRLIGYEAYVAFKSDRLPNAVWALHQLYPDWPHSGWDIRDPDDFQWALDGKNQYEILQKLEQSF